MKPYLLDHVESLGPTGATCGKYRLENFSSAAGCAKTYRLATAYTFFAENWHLVT